MQNNRLHSLQRFGIEKTLGMKGVMKHGFIIGLICALTWPGATVGNDHIKEKSAPNTSTVFGGHPYCGVYCLYVVLKTAGREVRVMDLLKPIYLGHRKGSSFAELRKAAEDYGMDAKSVGHLTCDSLRSLPYRALLHTKSSFGTKDYDHYVLYLGTEYGKAKILDPTNPVKLVSFPELAALWDGNGLIVSSQPIDLTKVFAPARKRFILLAAFIVAIVLLIHWTRRFVPQDLFRSRRAFLGLSLTEGTGLVIVTLLGGLLYHLHCDDGLLANAKVSEAIQQAHAGNFIPKISRATAHRLLGHGTIFIDARLRRDFQSGHLDGAISLPVDSNDTQRQQITTAIPRDSRIVVYCQSKGCRFAERVALQLQDDGFSNVAIYRGGWNEWVAKDGNNKTKDSRS